MRNAVLLSKQIGMGYVKIHGFHGNPLYDSLELGGGGGQAYKFNHI